MKILVIQPKKVPEEREINGSLESMQAVVGGLIQAVYPFEDSVALICNEEGKLLGLPWNRALYDDEDNLYEIIAGTFFVCSIDNDDFCSLTDEQTETYRKRFARPEVFIRLAGQIIAVPAGRAVPKTKVYATPAEMGFCVPFPPVFCSKTRLKIYVALSMRF